MDQLPGFLDNAKSIVQEIKDDLVRVGQYIIDDLGRLGDENARQRCQGRVYDFNFHEVVKCADMFIARAEDVFEMCSGKNSIQCIKEKIDNGQLNGLNDFFRQFREILSDCEKKYSLFQEESQRVEINCGEAIAQCERQAIEAEIKRNKMQVIGAATTGGLLGIGAGTTVSAVGSVVSVLVGASTFGLGTIAGLILTTGMAGSAGMAGSRSILTNEYNGYQYNKVASKLRKKAKIMDKIHKRTISLSNALITLKGEIERKETKLSDQEKRYQYITTKLSYKIKTGICHLLNLLQTLIFKLDLKGKMICIICIVSFCVWLYFPSVLLM